MQLVKRKIKFPDIIELLSEKLSCGTVFENLSL